MSNNPDPDGWDTLVHTVFYALLPLGTIISIILAASIIATNFS